MTISSFLHVSTSNDFAWLPVISRDGRYLATNGYTPTYLFDAAAIDGVGPLLIDLDAGTAHVIALPRAGILPDAAARVYGIEGDTVLFMPSQHDPMILPAQSPSSSYFIESKDGATVAPIASYADGMVRVSATPGLAALSGDGMHVALSGTQFDAGGNAMGHGLFEVDLRSGAVTVLQPTLPHADATLSSLDTISVSADGGKVVFVSRGLLADPVGLSSDLLAYDVTTHVTQLVNTNTGGVAADNFTFPEYSVSGNGRYVAFTSSATNLVAGLSTLPTTTVYVKDLLTGAIVAASTDSTGGVHSASLNLITQAISDDGRYVVFESSDDYGYKQLDNLPVPALYGPLHHVFVKDMVTGAVALVNSTPETMGLEAHGAAISGNGAVIVFQGVQWQDAAFPHNQFETYALPLPVFQPVTSDDVLSGGAGPDTLAAGLGNDTYRVNDRGDLVVEYAGAGRDTVHATVSYTLPDNVEALVLDGVAALDGAGNALANTLSGNAAANRLSGGAGDDLIIGGGGADTIDGGAGSDTARFSGKIAAYQITGGAQATVHARAGNDNVVLTAVEKLQFDDAMVTFDTGGANGQAYRLYQAAFDRTPDAAGVGYWMAQMAAGATLDTVAGAFIASAEFKQIAGAAQSDAAFVSLLYQHVLHRAPDPAGAAYWIDLLDRHVVDHANVLAQFSESTENQAALVGVLKNGIVYEPYDAA